jgi:hypothetical protein
MSGAKTLSEKLDEHRQLIEEQHIEIQRQRRQLEVQFRRTADVQAALDLINATLRRTAPNLRPTRKDHGNGNGKGHQADVLRPGTARPPRPSPE